jgi:hypothetical protein
VAKDWDPREARRMVAWLTPRGQEVVSRMLETVECESEKPIGV